MIKNTRPALALKMAKKINLKPQMRNGGNFVSASMSWTGRRDFVSCEGDNYDARHPRTKPEGDGCFLSGTKCNYDVTSASGNVFSLLPGMYNNSGIVCLVSAV